MLTLLYYLTGINNSFDSSMLWWLLSDGEVRLVNGTSGSSGRVEVYYLEQWGTICDDYFGNYDARVICKMLGFSVYVNLYDLVSLA